jgi:hypothetical protein
MLLLATAAFSASSERFSSAGGAVGQRRKPRKITRPQASAKSKIDYATFSHATRQHQEACTTCHKIPTANSAKLRGYPDVADFPDHDACVRCHRQQFFKGAQPVICGDCHTKTSPRDEARFRFRNPDHTWQFMIEFPHDKHQDVIARLRLGRPLSRPLNETRFMKVSLSSLVNPMADDRKPDYNNCTLCHETNTREPATPRDGWVDRFIPQANAFKTHPEGHSACFSCHWKGQEPTRDNCAGCHKLTSARAEPARPERKSLKFTHSREQHVAECTTCHINITKAASLRGLKPDVPITGCTECHNKAGLREDLSKELAAIDVNKDSVCSYCHTSEIGKRDPPASHYLVAERQPRTRKDLK